MLVAKHDPFTVSEQSSISRLFAWHVKATAAAVVNIRDGGAAGPIVIPLEIGANVAVGDNYEHPLVSTNGWYVEVVSGTVVGSLSGD